MSTLSVTTVQSANGTTDLTIRTGNTSNPGIVQWANTGTTYVGGNNVSYDAFFGISNNNSGIAGQSNTNNGVQAYTNTGNALFARANGSGTGILVLANTGTIAQFGNATATIATVTQAGMNVQTNTFNLGTSSIATNGYSYLPNGLLLQWFTGVANQNSTASLTFPITFPTAVYSVSATSNATAPAFASTITTSGIVLKTTSVTSSTIYVMAIGG